MIEPGVLNLINLNNCLTLKNSIIFDPIVFSLLIKVNFKTGTIGWVQF